MKLYPCKAYVSYSMSPIPVLKFPNPSSDKRGTSSLFVSHTINGFHSLENWKIKKDIKFTLPAKKYKF